MSESSSGNESSFNEATLEGKKKQKNVLRQKRQKYNSDWGNDKAFKS